MVGLRIVVAFDNTPGFGVPGERLCNIRVAAR